MTPRSRKPRAESRASIEDPHVAISDTRQFIEFFGLDRNLPNVTVESALRVPAVAAIVAFLPRTLAALPLLAYRRGEKGPVRLTGKIDKVIHENPNPEMDRFKAGQFFWQQVFTGGRGLMWIEWAGNNIEALWPFDATRTAIKRRGMKLVYVYGGKEYSSDEVIDIPFMFRPNMTGHYGPIQLASKAIQLALAMNDYASSFFAGGGIPPLALVGPLPVGPEGIRRAQADIKRAVDAAKKNDEAVFPIPPGYKLEPVGIDPAKGQMTEARLFQVQEIARVWQMPPVFVMDLSKGNFANTEQQDLHLVKHLVAQWAKALEGEMNLKIFGRLNNNRYVEHNLDGLLRGDFKTRMEGLARGIQTAQLTPNEARKLDNRPAMPNGDTLLVQGATVPLGSQPLLPAPAQPDDGNQNGGVDDPGATDAAAAA